MGSIAEIIAGPSIVIAIATIMAVVHPSFKTLTNIHHQLHHHAIIIKIPKHTNSKLSLYAMQMQSSPLLKYIPTLKPKLDEFSHIKRQDITNRTAEIRHYANGVNVIMYNGLNLIRRVLLDVWRIEMILQRSWIYF